MKRIGLIGFGYIGAGIYERIVTQPALGLEVVFVHNRTATKLTHVPTDLILPDLADFAHYKADLIVEVAHPDITRQYGSAFLGQADYFILSATALADATLQAHLLETCKQHHTQLVIPHGSKAVTSGSLSRFPLANTRAILIFRLRPLPRPKLPNPPSFMTAQCVASRNFIREMSIRWSLVRWQRWA